MRLAMVAVLPVVVLGTAHAHADEITLRMATIAPDGTGWARELRAFARDVENGTSGRVRVKWYFGAVAGDELEAMHRVERGQLDGTGSGGMMCERIMPSMRSLRLPAVFQSRDEAAAVAGRLFNTLEDEATKSGYALLVSGGMGPDVYFTRTPVRTLAELRKVRLWRWNLDEVGIITSRAMGLQIVPASLEDAARMYDTGQVDGFILIPTAALAYQLSVRARYVTDLRGGYLEGCVLLRGDTYHRLTPEDRVTVKAAAARLAVRWEELGRRQDDALLGGVFTKQGDVLVPVSESFRSEYFGVAQSVREKLGEQLVGAPLLNRVLRMLADYRAEHPAPGARR
jgi:TRAP-type C4-dicarboxylate transport system substrate-binding protein